MVYRAKASLSFGPAAIRRFDASGYKDRLAQSSALSTTATLNAQARATERKAAAKFAQEQENAAELERAQQGIRDRAATSKTNVQKLQMQTAGQYAKLNEQQAAQQAKVRSSGNYQRAVKLGANGYENPNFQSSPGRVVATGPASKKAAAIINEALKYRGRMYQWGGASPATSFDCSGLIQWAYKSVGVSIPRVSNDQANYGRKVPVSAARPGDLIAWDNSSRNNGADHIAIYIGNGKVVESARPGTPIRVSPIAGMAGQAWGVQILK